MKLVCGNSLEELKNLADESIDSLVTDPPAGISFMGKSWDGDLGGREQWIAWMFKVMRECLRVLKPGAHGLVWAIPRTSHWTATALEDAGFEVRDVITHLFGSGFPKSHNIEKATGDARFKGIGTALKPASEHWILVRKPCSEKTVAANVLKWGCGGINIDVSRIAGAKRSPEFKNPESELGYHKGSSNKNLVDWDASQGRFPANLVLSHNEDCVEVGTKKVKNKGGVPNAYTKKNTRPTFTSNQETSTLHHFDEDGTETVSAFECTPGCAVAELDRQSGVSKSPKTYIRNADGENANSYGIGMGEKAGKESLNFGDSGGASRFFYCAKASKREKGEGNSHPTVKATKLMSYLINMITPPQGIVLDPFMGSGSTGVAAKQSGFDFIGIEKEQEYMTIAENRIKAILV